MPPVQRHCTTFQDRSSWHAIVARFQLAFNVKFYLTLRDRNMNHRLSSVFFACRVHISVHWQTRTHFHTDTNLYISFSSLWCGMPIMKDVHVYVQESINHHCLPLRLHHRNPLHNQPVPVEKGKLFIRNFFPMMAQLPALKMKYKPFWTCLREKH